MKGISGVKHLNLPRASQSFTLTESRCCCRSSFFCRKTQKAKFVLFLPLAKWKRKQTFPLSSSVMFCSVSVATPPPHPSFLSPWRTESKDVMNRKKAGKSFDTLNGFLHDCDVRPSMLVSFFSHFFPSSFALLILWNRLVTLKEASDLSEPSHLQTPVTPGPNDASPAENKGSFVAVKASGYDYMVLVRFRSSWCFIMGSSVFTVKHCGTVTRSDVYTVVCLV